MVFPLGASDSEMLFRRLSVADGLSQNTVRSIAQDALGNIWMGTQNGLNRYDGYGFLSYYANPADSTALADNAIYSLLTDSRHRLWIGTASTLSYLAFSENRFYNYPSPGGKHIYCMLEDEGMILVGSDEGLWYFDPQTRRFEQEQSLVNVQVRSVCKSDDALLVATKSGLVRLEKRGEAHWQEDFLGMDVSAVAQIGGTGWWIGTHGSGLFRTDSNFRTVRHFGVDAGSLPSNYIRVLRTDAYGRLWVGTYDGLAVFNDLSGSFDFYYHNQAPTSLAHDSIWSLFVDRQKGVWVGTWFGGANYWNRQQDKMRTLSLASPGVYGFVSCLASDPQSEGLWIGTNDDGVFHYDAQLGQFSRIATPGVPGNIKCILPDGNERLFVGTHLGGLAQVDIANGKVLHSWNVNPETPIYNGCYSLLADRDSTLWTGTPDGLLRFDLKTRTFSPHPATRLDSRLSHLLVSQLLRDRQDRVWIGTDAGLFRVEADRKYVFFFEGMAGGADCSVNAIREASDGVIWVATSRGLFRIVDDSFTHYTVQEGLPNDYVCGILEDSSRRLWLSTGGGICSMDPEGESFKLLHDAQANEYTVGSCCAGQDGTFYFGGLAGITAFRPLEQGANPYALVPYVQDIRTERNEYCTRTLGPDGDLAEAVLSPEANLVTIFFSAVDPLSTDNRFSYRLEGFDDQWYDTSARSVRYSNLSPGRYVFRLRVENCDGVPGRQEAEFTLRIRPHWWQTVLARLFLILLSLGITGLLVWAFISRSKMKIQLQVERLERQQVETSLMRTREMLMNTYSSADTEGANLAPTADEEFLRRAMQVVEANLDNEQFSSQDFADQMHMSRSNLYLRITSVTGESANQFVRRIRLTRACQLLLERRYSIAEISAKVGFSSPSYFATAFKKYIGCPPAEYGKTVKT